MRIIVADDDVVSRLLLHSALERLGHECLLAENGDEAWRLFQEQSPEVVITDWLMPVMNGLELCRRIRRETRESYTYVIVATSLVERGNVRAGMEAGADDYLTKPLDPFDLETRLVAAKRVTSLHAELARYRTELSWLAGTDPLTQLRNRLSLSSDLTSLHGRSERFRRGYCLVMCDVDFFKAYNDANGHQAGDDVLRSVAAALRAEVRQGDSIYRYGGEELLILLPQQDIESAAVVAERVRHTVEALGIAHPGGTPAGVITLSIGVAASRPGDGRTSDDLLREADAALYEAKAQGRNRVVLARAEGPWSTELPPERALEPSSNPS